ncbi:hypothetical protein EC991_005724 [Linnemannia zychae]|nr:hypothetical protein EC991_005724 [Linnemannia zychae]
MPSLSRWKGKVKETLIKCRIKRPKKDSSTINVANDNTTPNINDYNDNNTQLQKRYQQPIAAADDEEERQGICATTSVADKNDKNSRRRKFLRAFSLRQDEDVFKPAPVSANVVVEQGREKKKKEEEEEEEVQHKQKKQQRDRRDGNGRSVTIGRLWPRRKKGEPAHNNDPRDVASAATTTTTTTTTATTTMTTINNAPPARATAAGTTTTTNTSMMNAEHCFGNAHAEEKRNDESTTTNNSNSTTTATPCPVGTRTTEGPHALTPVYRFRTLDVYPAGNDDHDNYLTAAPALQIPHCPTVFTHRPSCEPNAAQVHHPQRDPSITTVGDDYYDDKDWDWVLEQPRQEPLLRQGPTAQDEDSNEDDDVSVLDVARFTAKTEIAASTLSSLLLQTQTQTPPPFSTVAFPLPFPEASPVPIKFVSAQGPRRGPQPSDQSASWDKDKDEQNNNLGGLILSHQHDNNNNNSENQHPPFQQQQGQTQLWSVLPHELGLEAALGECLGDIAHFSPVSANSVINRSSSSTTTSQDDDDDDDDNKDVCQHHHHDEQDVAIPSPSLSSHSGALQDSEPIYRHPLRSPTLVKDAVVTTIVTTVFADAVLDLNRDLQVASPLQHLYQFQRLLSPPQVAATIFSDSLPPRPASPPLPVPSPSPLPHDGDRDDDQESIVTLPAPVSIAVPDTKGGIYEQGPVDLNAIEPAPLPVILLPGQPQEDANTQQNATSTSPTKTDASFLNGWLAGTFSWWTKPTTAPAPAPAPVPSLVITPAPMADA